MEIVIDRDFSSEYFEALVQIMSLKHLIYLDVYKTKSYVKTFSNFENLGYKLHALCKHCLEKND